MNTEGHGLVIPPITNREEGIDHVLGSANLPEPIINASGDWLPFLPDREPQNVNGIETYACAVYATLSALETLLKQKGYTVNYSDRYIANLAKNKGILNPKVGSDPHLIAELIRTTSGNTEEANAPWRDDYYNLDVVPLIPHALEWYKEWRLSHKWVFVGGTPQEKREKLKEALTKGVVCASVNAWWQKNGLYYKPEGTTDTHWIEIAKVKDGEPDRIFDSYDMYIKDLDPLYDFYMAKVYFLTPAPHVFTKNLGYQMTDPEVAYLQKALISLKYNIPHAVTNLFGSETRSALHSFQRDNGIEDNGEHFGPRTRAALNQKMNPTSPFGGSLITYLSAFFSQT